MLAKEHISRIQGEITSEVVVRVALELSTYIAQGAKNATLYINSNGGDVEAGLKLHQLILTSPIPIKGVAVGKCGSIAFTILQACHRRVAKGSKVVFLVHFLTFLTSAVVFYNEAARSSVRERHIKLQEAIISKQFIKSHLSREEILQLLFAGENITAEKALALALIDEII